MCIAVANIFACYEWITNSVYIVHAILKILATLLRLTKLLPTLGISSYNLTGLKSGSTHLDPNEPIGTDGGNLAFRIVFCSVDITTTNAQPNIEIPQPYDNALRSHEPTARICPELCHSVGFCNHWGAGGNIMCPRMISTQLVCSALHTDYIYMWDMFHILVKECVGFVIIKATLVFY